MMWNWDVTNDEYLQKTIERCKNQKIILPTFKQLKHPLTIPTDIQDKLENVDIQATHPLNLLRSLIR